MELSTDTSIRDPVYYFRIVVFKVGDTIFKVPRNGFEVPGTVFETMFTLPGDSVEVDQCEGSSEDNPIVLPVDKDHFRGFLGAMYPFSGRGMTRDDWIGALDLATMWTFKEIRKRAILALNTWVTQTLEPREAAFLAKKYEVLSWLKQSYSRLLQRNLTLKELRSHPALDWETIARLLLLKQPKLGEVKYFCSHCNKCLDAAQSRCPLCDPIHAHSIDHAFLTEFKSMDSC